MTNTIKLKDLSGALRFDESTSAKIAEAARAIEQRNAQVAESISANWSPVIVQRQLLEAVNIGERIGQQLRLTELTKLDEKLTDALRLPELGAIGARAANIAAEFKSGFLPQTPQVIRPFPSFEITQSPANDAPHIIEPTAEDIEAIANAESPNLIETQPKQNKGGRPSHAWRYKGLEDLARDLLERGEAKSCHGCAVIIVRDFGFTHIHNVWEKSGGLIVFGASENAAIRRLSEHLKSVGI